MNKKAAVTSRGQPTLRAQRKAQYGVGRPLPVERKKLSINQDKGLFSHSKKRWRTYEDTTSSDDLACLDVNSNTSMSVEGLIEPASGPMPRGSVTDDEASVPIHANESPTPVGPRNEQSEQAVRAVGSEAYQRRKFREARKTA